MIKFFVIWLLGLGMIPVMLSPISAKINPEDSLSLVRYKIKQSGIHRNEIARELNLSIDCVHKTLRGKYKNKLNSIIKFVNKRIV